MDTKKLFQQDAYIKSCTAKIIDICEFQGKTLIELDQTVFFPTGGGQSCDKGKINNLEVLDVYEKEGHIFHQVALEGSNKVLSVGEEVKCELDWEHRFLNMQRHCGEHILSGIFYREYGGVNRGFHMGDSYMTIDISLEDNPEFKTLTWDMVKRAEMYANEVIWSNAPVITRRYETYEEAKDLPLRKALAIEKDISIVCVGSIENPSDCVACCGTHPSTAGQVGLIKILKLENYKGMFRIYCEAGKRALEIFDEYHETLTTIGNRYSASPENVLEKLGAQESKIKGIKDELHRLKTALINAHVEELTDILNSNEDKNIVVKEYDDLSVDDLLKTSKGLPLEKTKILMLVSRREQTILLFSDGKIDCGKLVKENASIYQGKGGGNNISARAIFPKEDSIDIFIDLICKHLR